MVFDTVRDLLAEQFSVDPEEITPSTDIVDDLGADSLDVVDFTMTLEDTFDIDTVPDEELDELRTVAAVVEYIEAHSRS